MAHEILSLKLCELEDRLVNIPPKLNSLTAKTEQSSRRD